MSNKSPIFPMAEPQHLSDYGFDPQIDYFQVLEEARRHKKETSRSTAAALHFKVQKPISKDEHSKKTHKITSMKKKRWWKNALPLFRWKKWNVHNHQCDTDTDTVDVHRIRASISGPIYITESRATPTTYRTSRRPSSGPLGLPGRKGDSAIPYLSLRELNMERRHLHMPIYLVT